MTETSSVLVSVIIPVHNVERYLEDCVASVLAQSHYAIEVILIDDGSTDKSAAIARSFVDRDPRVSVLTQENHGVSAARNAGLGAAAGEWITFVDADDWVAPEFITHMLNTAVVSGAEFVVSTSVLLKRNKAIPSERSGGFWLWDSERAVEALLYPGIPIGCWNKLYKAEDLRRSELQFLPQFLMGEGLNFIVAYAQIARSVAFTNAALYFYRRDNAESATTRLSHARMQNALEAISNVEREMKLNSPHVRLALDFHRWRTEFLLLTALRQSALPQHVDEYNQLRVLVQRNGLRLIFRARISLRERVKSAAIAIAPTAMAIAAIGKRRRRLDRAPA